MKRRIDRDEKLPFFKCDLESLQPLLDSIADLFEPDSVNVGLSAHFGREETDFDTVNDIKDNLPRLPAALHSIRVFALSSREGAYRSFAIYTSDFSGGATVSARAASEAWCAGAAEVAKQFARKHRRWYFFLRPWHFFAFSVLFGLCPMIAWKIFDTKTISSNPMGSAWLIVQLAAFLLFIGFHRVFPPVTIVLSDRRAFLSKYSSEITAIAAVLTLLLAILVFVMGR